jgi:hypothetical protein
VKIDPIVLLLPMADNLVSIRMDAAETFVSIILVLVILTVVIVPPIIRSPERLILAPVNVLAETRVELTVLKVPDVAKMLPVVILDTLRLEIVALVTLTFPMVTLSDIRAAVEILVVANKVPVVNPDVSLSELILELVITVLVVVKFVADSVAVLILVLDSKLPAVKFVNITLVLLIFVVVKLLMVELEASKLFVDTFNDAVTLVAVTSPVKLNVPPVALRK